MAVGTSGFCLDMSSLVTALQSNFKYIIFKLRIKILFQFGYIEVKTKSLFRTEAHTKHSCTFGLCNGTLFFFASLALFIVSGVLLTPAISLIY